MCTDEFSESILDGDGGGSPSPPPLPPQQPAPISAPDPLDTAPDGKPCEGVREWVEEARRHHRAATEALKQVADLRAQLASLEGELSVAREALDHAERRAQIDLMLLEAEAIDLESVRLLTELAMNNAGGSADPAAAVADLRRRKPFLFRTSDPPSSSRFSATLSPSSRTTATSAALDHAAEEAALTGNRAALLRYLRARRGDEP